MSLLVPQYHTLFIELNNNQATNLKDSLKEERQNAIFAGACAALPVSHSRSGNQRFGDKRLEPAIFQI